MGKHGHRRNFLDAHEILGRVQANDIPSTWRVFHTSQKKLSILILGFCGIMCLFIAFIVSYLVGNFDHHPSIPPDAFYAIMVIVFLFAISSAFLSFFIWVRTKNAVLVLLPEEFVYGDSKKSKVFFTSFYKDIASMHVNGPSVLVYINGKVIPKQIDYRLFEYPARDIALVLFRSFSGFKNRSHNQN